MRHGIGDHDFNRFRALPSKLVFYVLYFIPFWVVHSKHALYDPTSISSGGYYENVFFVLVPSCFRICRVTRQDLPSSGSSQRPEVLWLADPVHQHRNNKTHQNPQNGTSERELKPAALLEYCASR